MSNFYDVSFENHPVEDCDRVALEHAGVLQSFGYGYALPRGGPVNSEYASRVVGRRGMGNHGKLVLIGLTGRARALLRQGKIRHLAAAGIPVDVAEVSVSMPYGMEIPVAALAARLAPVVRDYGPFPGDHLSGRRKLETWAGFAIETSYPRAMAACAIAERMAS